MHPKKFVPGFSGRLHYTPDKRTKLLNQDAAGMHVLLPAEVCAAVPIIIISSTESSGHLAAGLRPVASRVRSAPECHPPMGWGCGRQLLSGTHPRLPSASTANFGSCRTVHFSHSMHDPTLRQQVRWPLQLMTDISDMSSCTGLC